MDDYDLNIQRKKKESINTYDALAKFLNEFDENQLSGKAKFGESMQSDEIVVVAIAIKQLYDLIHRESLLLLPHDVIEELNDKMRSHKKYIDMIVSLQPGQDRVYDTLKEYRDKLRKSYSEAFKYACPIFAYVTVKDVEAGMLGNSIDSIREEHRRFVDKFHEDFAAINKDVKSTVEQIRSAAVQQAVTQQASHFAKAACDHENNAYYWLVTTVAVSVVILLFASALLGFSGSMLGRPGDALEASQQIAGKVLVFASLGYFLALAARNYTASRHNAVINRHRENSLNTYETIVKASGSDDNKNAILVKAAETIFGAQPTGYGKIEGGETGVVNIIGTTQAAKTAG